MVREYSTLRYESFMGWGIPLSLPLMRGVAHNHGLSKVFGGSGVLNCLRLFWEGLDAPGHFLRHPVSSEYSFIELWVVCLQRSLVPVP